MSSFYLGSGLRRPKSRPPVYHRSGVSSHLFFHPSFGRGYGSGVVPRVLGFHDSKLKVKSVDDRLMFVQGQGQTRSQRDRTTPIPSTDPGPPPILSFTGLKLVSSDNSTCTHTCACTHLHTHSYVWGTSHRSSTLIDSFTFSVPTLVPLRTFHGPYVRNTSVGQGQDHPQEQR